MFLLQVVCFLIYLFVRALGCCCSTAEEKGGEKDGSLSSEVRHDDTRNIMISKQPHTKLEETVENLNPADDDSRAQQQYM